jgi:hypothetical protein
MQGGEMQLLGADKPMAFKPMPLWMVKAIRIALQEHQRRLHGRQGV